MAFRRPLRDHAPAAPPDGTPRLVALRLLGRRDYTTDELTRKLLDRGFTREHVETALVQLTTDGFLSDRRAALAHVRMASQVKGRGPIRIRQELQARGVSADVVTEATNGVTDEDVRLVLDRVIARKRLSQPLSQDARRRLFQQLLRRGFPARVISTALKFTPDADT